MNSRQNLTHSVTIPVQFRRTEHHLILVASHAYWKERLCNAISSKEILDVNEIVKDDSCDLGHWLRSVEQHPHITELQSYRDLISKNVEFHIQASKVAKHINARNYSAALRLTGCKSAFEYSSTAVILAIFCLKKEATKLH
ncbi:MAG: CZB domain-containing protein [Methylococcaceae bacterium]